MRLSGAPERMVAKTALARAASMAELMKASRMWPFRTALPEKKPPGWGWLSKASNEGSDGASFVSGEERSVRSEASRVRSRCVR